MPLKVLSQLYFVFVFVFTMTFPIPEQFGGHITVRFFGSSLMMFAFGCFCISNQRLIILTDEKDICITGGVMCTTNDL